MSYADLHDQINAEIVQCRQLYDQFQVGMGQPRSPPQPPPSNSPPDQHRRYDLVRAIDRIDAALVRQLRCVLAQNRAYLREHVLQRESQSASWPRPLISSAPDLDLEQRGRRIGRALAHHRCQMRSDKRWARYVRRNQVREVHVQDQGLQLVLNRLRVLYDSVERHAHLAEALMSVGRQESVTITYLDLMHRAHLVDQQFHLFRLVYQDA